MSDDAKGKFIAAMAAAQKSIKNAKLNRTNPHYKSKYADLQSIRDAIQVALAENGICYVQLIKQTDAGLMLITKLMHEAGHEEHSEYPIPAYDKPQAIGSAITYGRRYSLAAIIGVSSEEDDDANIAQENYTPKKTNNAEKQQNEKGEIKINVPKEPGYIQVTGRGHDETALAQSWVRVFKDVIKMAKSEEDISAWVQGNQGPLNLLDAMGMQDDANEIQEIIEKKLNQGESEDA